MKEWIDYFANGTTTLVVLAYFMFRDYQFISELKQTMSVVKEYVKKQEKKLEESEGKEND